MKICSGSKSSVCSQRCNTDQILTIVVICAVEVVDLYTKPTIGTRIGAGGSLSEPGLVAACYIAE